MTQEELDASYVSTSEAAQILNKDTGFIVWLCHKGRLGDVLRFGGKSGVLMIPRDAVESFKPGRAVGKAKQDVAKAFEDGESWAADICSELKFFRIRLDLTHQETAKHLGVSKISLMHYEKGITRPSAEVREKMAEVYGVDIDKINAAIDKGFVGKRRRVIRHTF